MRMCARFRCASWPRAAGRRRPSEIESLESRICLSGQVVASSTPITLGSPTQVPVGNTPVNVATADFNNDGLPDLVTANASGTVSVLLNEGDGNFAPADNLRAGQGPYGVVTADFNKDGKPDFAVSNAVGGTVSIFLGNGDGTFRRRADYRFGTATTFAQSRIAPLVTGDFNADGNLDLAVADNVDGTISVLLNNGNGTVGRHVDSSMSGVNRLVAADVNGDGRTDLLTTNSSDDAVFALLSNSSGNGSFGGPLTISLRGTPEALLCTDLNGDGKPDLAVAVSTSSGTALDVRLGSGTGNFISFASYTLDSGPTAMTAADFNGDGREEVAVATSSGPLDLFVNNGDGTLQPRQGFAGLQGGAGPSMVAADLDGDGKVDVAVPESVSRGGANDAVGVLFGGTHVGSGIGADLVPTITAALPMSAASGGRLRGVAVVNLRNEGVAAASGPATVELFLSTDPTSVAGAVPLRTVRRAVRLGVGSSTTVRIPLRRLPAIASGTYFLVAQVSGDNSPVNAAATANAVTITSPPAP